MCDSFFLCARLSRRDLSVFYCSAAAPQNSHTQPLPVERVQQLQQLHARLGRQRRTHSWRDARA
ncbi:hypothetical protein Fuma_03468 [Fuerstiella marisgermanici]|uniref:Uncharacterized protein n=1 Tax=Fuerstiella marisgermanici TaxID=1891926 RepID=A0A1P8WIF9_9PLAN|nr:hypothetical protein Fuma_03468 [Fuerstiella marisgermanici]